MDEKGSNNLKSDGEFDRPGAEQRGSLWLKKLEEMEGSVVIVRKYLDNIYYFGARYPQGEPHKEALEALQRIEKGLKELETLSKM